MKSARFGGSSSGAGRRSGVTLVEMIIAIVLLALGLSGLFNLLEASERASARIYERAVAATLSRKAASDMVLTGYASAWRRVWALEPGAEVQVSFEEVQAPGGRSADERFFVSTRLRRLENDGVLARAFAWREPWRPEGLKAPPPEEQSAADAFPPGDALWEKTEIAMFPPLLQPIPAEAIARAHSLALEAEEAEEGEE